MAHKRLYRKKTTRRTKKHGTRSKHTRHIRRVKSIKRRGGVCYGRMRGGNYEKDVTSAEFQGFPYKNEKSVVVSFPGTPGVMDLKEYKKLMEDEDREGYDPTA
jgi:hypothetical protein